MRRSAALAIGAIAIIGVIVLAWVTSEPQHGRVYWCDGSMPAWMLEAQDYQDTGCAYELPFWEAPPNADWTQVCLGLCPDSLLDSTSRPPSPRADE